MKRSSKLNHVNSFVKQHHIADHKGRHPTAEWSLLLHNRQAQIHGAPLRHEPPYTANSFNPACFSCYFIQFSVSNQLSFSNLLLPLCKVIRPHIYQPLVLVASLILMHSQTKLYPGEIVTIAIPFALKGGYFRAFYLKKGIWNERMCVLKRSFPC